MSERTEKSMKELIEEHGKEARDRWREVFDESRARGADATEASKVADEVLRLEVERGVLMPCAERALDRRARAFVQIVASHATVDGKRIDYDWIPRLAADAKEIARELNA
jgi:hypothetical protein